MHAPARPVRACLGVWLLLSGAATGVAAQVPGNALFHDCLLYTSDAADEL